MSFPPGTGVLVLGHGHAMKIRYVFSSYCLHWGMDQYIVMMTKDWSTKIVNFLLGRGHISYCGEYALCSTLTIYITLIVFVLRDYNNAAFLYHY